MNRAAAVAAALITTRPATRLGMLASLPRLKSGRGHPRQSIERAVNAVGFDRLSAEEREWEEHIEARRSQLHRREVAAQPFEEGLPSDVSSGSWWVSIPPTWGLFMLRLIRELAPASCLELGTGLGISTAYQAAALELNGGGRLVSIDGSPEWSAVAREGLDSLALDRVELCVGPIGEVLGEVLERSGPIDYALVDAEHTEAATLGYFEGLLPGLAPGAVVIFDDIPWTGELRRTWRAIKAHERVSAGFALGRMGVVIIA